jgi:hypothetical protein
LTGWHFIIYENLVDKKLVESSQHNGYLDYKKLMFGNAASGPLSLHLSVIKDGPVCGIRCNMIHFTFSMAGIGV